MGGQEVAESERGLEHDIAVGAGETPRPVPVPRPPTSNSNKPIDLGLDPPVDLIPMPESTPFHLQLYWTVYKNLLLLSRNPIKLSLMFLGPIISVLLTWPAAYDTDAPLSPFDECGTVPDRVIDKLRDDNQEIKHTLNEKWRFGVPTMILSVGPLLHGICAFLIVQGEIEKQLLGVLRVLGVRESVYWISWYLPSTVIALCNSLIAAGVAKSLPVHVFQEVYFGGIFASLFFLQLALVASSFFLAALCGSLKKLLIFIVAGMILAVFVPGLAMLYEVDWYGDYEAPGFFWVNHNTSYRMSYSYWDPDYYDPDQPYNSGYKVNHTYCDRPFITEELANSYSTDEEIAQVKGDEFATGCFKIAGFSTSVWNPTDSLEGFVLANLFMVPYFHFNNIFSNFLGFTGMPDKTFTAKHASKSPEELAFLSSPSVMSEENAKGSSLVSQGSLLIPKTKDRHRYGYTYEGNYDPWVLWMKDNNPDWTYDNYYDYYSWGNDFWGNETVYPHVCPDGALNGFPNLCPDMYSGWDCAYTSGSKATEGSPSVHDTIGYLLGLSLIYLLLASYWIQVFPARNGARRSFYFFLLPSYWYSPLHDRDDDQNSSCVEIKNMSKKFGSFQAVKDFTLKLRGGEVTALLGHNGAGKSTVINILSCEMQMSAGEISVFGKSVVDQFGVRQMIGVCKQDDYLWPNLSAKEHLDIFAGLRGVDPNLHDSIVEKWLESVDLTLIKHKYSAAFSGGMKRRLSVALATIGERPLVILDEPTTGLDPVNRRYVWKHLDEIKKNRVVLITTHAMEEADLLADEVAIMKEGNLAALGTPIELKSEHGSAIQFSILVDKHNVRRTELDIKDIFKTLSDAVTISSSEDVGNITVKIESLDEVMETDKLSKFVSWLESDLSYANDYGFSNSSLEEVFLAITKEDSEPNGSVDANEEGIEPGANLNEQDETFDRINHISAFRPWLNVQNQVEAWVRQTFRRKWSGKRSIGEYIFFGLLIIVTFVVAYLESENAQYGFIGFITLPVVVSSLLLLSTISPFYVDKSTGLLHLMQSQGLLEKSLILGSACYAFSVQFIYGFILFHAFYLAPFFRETQICQETARETCYTDDSLGQSYCNYDGCYDGEYGYEVQNPDLESNVKIFAVRSAGGYGTVFLTIFIFSLSTIGASLASSIFPGNYKFALIVAAVLTLAASLAPLINHFLFQFNSYWDYYYYDDTPIHRCMSSLDPLDLCNKNVVIGVNITAEHYMNCIGHAVNNEIISTPLCTPPYASLLPQFGVVQLFSLMFSSTIKFYANKPGYLEDEFFPILEGVDCGGSTCKFPHVQNAWRENALYFVLGAFLLILLGTTLFHLVHFTPSFMVKFKMSCRRLFSKTYSKMCCKDNKEQTGKQDFSERVILREVTEENDRVEDIIKPVLRKPQLENVEDGAQPSILDQATRSEADLPPVVMRGLRKVYPSSGKSPPKVALNTLSLHVPKGQVLGLLGKNGSGKSTCLKILSSNEGASGGIALVAGHDVSCERNEIYEELGSCPQFDVFWPNLSVKEHLVFFARLKGLPRTKVMKIAHDVATAVGLGSSDVYKRNAGLLSGGMRRRLSIAISMLGAPGVLLLDEMTTGLDPSTRNGIWALVGAFATIDRAVIITTHMMIEADTLCNRIAIIKDGNLEVVASQQQLKNKYGSGYTLQLNLGRSSQLYQDRAMEFVHKYINEDAKLDHKQAKTLHVSLPRDQSIAKVFNAMYSPERTSEGCINQFLLQQSSLEDVFVALG